MSFTLPDKGEGQNDIQSIMFQEYWAIMLDGIAGSAYVLTGGVCTAQGSPNMTVAVSKAAVMSGGVLRAVAAANATIGTADGTNPRIDLVVIDASGAIQTRAGTAAAAPKPPTRTAGDVALCSVLVPASDTTISTDQIDDKRYIVGGGALTIYKTTAAETTNNTSAAIQVLNKADSGVTIPNGLFLSGRTLRVRLGGNMLLNSGTPTVRVAIAFGGTTMFSDISGASTADADRAAWALDFDIVAQGDSDQSLNGTLAMGIIASKTAPTTGIGDAWSTANNVNAVSGSAAVNCDTGNRVLSVQITLSVANAANEVVTEYATVELM